MLPGITLQNILPQTQNNAVKIAPQYGLCAFRPWQELFQPRRALFLKLFLLPKGESYSSLMEIEILPYTLEFCFLLKIEKYFQKKMNTVNKFHTQDAAHPYKEDINLREGNFKGSNDWFKRQSKFILRF